MQLRFSNYDPEELAKVLDYDITTGVFSFSYAAFTFETKRCLLNPMPRGDLVFYPKHKEIVYTDKFILDLVKNLSKNFACSIDTQKTKSNNENKDICQLIKFARIKCDFP